MKINLNDIEYIIFDCDGVILDSNKTKTKAFRETLKKYPKESIDQLILFHTKNGGVSRKIKFEYFFNKILKIKNNKKLVDQSLILFKKISFNKLVKSEYIKGVLKFIKILRLNSIKIFIVSGALQDELKEIFSKKKKLHLFDEILGTPVNKTNNIKYLLKKYNLDKSKGIFFGDSKTDYLAAKKFQIRFIFVANKSEWTDFKKVITVNKINTFNDIRCQF